jgi:hypothetical protein
LSHMRMEHTGRHSYMLRDHSLLMGLFRNLHRDLRANLHRDLRILLLFFHNKTFIIV